jgi:hypothetical protein
LLCSFILVIVSPTLISIGFGLNELPSLSAIIRTLCSVCICAIAAAVVVVAGALYLTKV